MTLGKRRSGFLCLALAVAASVSAQPASEKDQALHYRGTLSLSLMAGAVASTAVPAEIFKTPPACRWCSGSDPNVIDRWASEARWENPCRAGRLSYATLGASAAAALIPLSHEKNARAWMTNAGVVADSVAVTVMVTQLVKYAVRRERPAPDSCHPDRETDHDRNLSFFSGHAAVAFTLISSAHETRRLRGRSSDNGWLVAGGAAAALTAYLRVAGDRHHLIDVLAGAGVGYAIGKWVPGHVVRRTEPGGPTMRRAGADYQPQTAPSLMSYSKPFGIGDRNLLLQVGKGPGRSLQFGLRF